MADRIRLGDDGTMDTVLYCSDCGQEFRFNLDVCEDIQRDDTGRYIVGNKRYRTEEQAGEALRDEWIDGIIAETEDEHICREEEE